MGSMISIGAAHIDRRGILRGPTILGTSNRGDVYLDFGGVARNVGENLARLGCQVSVLSRVGDDADGRRVVAHLESLGIETELISRSPERPTASYTAILENNGELVIGLADMDIYEEIDVGLLHAALPRMQAERHWFIDTNVPGSAIEWLLETAGNRSVYVDAVSVVRSRRLRPLLSGISVLFVNIAQAAEIAEAPGFRDTAEASAALRALGAEAGVVTAGARDLTVWIGEDARGLAVLPAKPRDVTGAGDALVAGTVAALIEGRALHEAVRWGLAAAAITVESARTTAPELCLAMLKQRAGI